MFGDDSKVVNDSDCLDLPFFLSSHMTAFQTKLLLTLTVEILLGQLSYKQRAEICDYTIGYDSQVKKGMPSAECSESADCVRYVHVYSLHATTDNTY